MADLITQTSTDGSEAYVWHGDAAAQSFHITTVSSITGIRYYAKRTAGYDGPPTVPLQIKLQSFGGDITYDLEEVDIAGWSDTEPEWRSAALALDNASGLYQIVFKSNHKNTRILLEASSSDPYEGGILYGLKNGGGSIPNTWDAAFVIEGTAGASPPSKASDPTPTDGAVAGETDWSTPTLSWTGDGDTYDVYIDTDGTFIASDRVAEGIADTTYTLTDEQKAAFADLSDGVTNLYWRVDSTNDEGTTEGDTWTFDPRPGQPTLDVPANGSTVQLTQPLSWEFGTYADTVDVFIKPDDTLEITQLATGTTDTSYEWDDDFLTWGTGYTWQVVCKNYYGETDGPDWTFTAATLDHPRVTYHLLDGGSGAGPYDTPAGEEGVDYVWTGENCMATTKRLVLAAASKFWYEDRA